MSALLVQCPSCKTTLIDGNLNLPGLTPCSSCGTPIRIEMFPAFFRRASAGREAEVVMVEGESTCFYHPSKKAVLPCHSCGRFLCALCDCELNGEHFCPACLEAGKTKGKIKSLENQRTLYDSIAFALATYPVLILFGIYFTFITAPMAIYVAIRYWNAPRSIVPRSRIRYVVALLFAGLQIVGWVYVVYSIATRPRFHA